MACRAAANACRQLGGKRRPMLMAVYEDVNWPSGPVPRSTGSTHGTAIRVCQGRLGSACNPGVCNCEADNCVREGKKTKMMLTALKVGILAFMIEESFKYGIWGDAQRTANLSHDYLLWAKDFFWTRNKINRTPAEVYEMWRIKYNLKYVWNKIIFWINDMLTAIPALIGKIEFKKKKQEEAAAK